MCGDSQYDDCKNNRKFWQSINHGPNSGDIHKVKFYFFPLDRFLSLAIHSLLSFAGIFFMPATVVI